MALKDQIIADMTAAMKAKDAARTSTLRMLKAAIMNREKEGGDAGGHVVATGTPEEIMKAKGSYTGRYLRAHITRSNGHNVG